MGALKLQYLTNENGDKIGVLLSIEHYNEIMEQLEELEDIKAYDKAKDDEVIPYEQAIKEIESQRKDV